MNIIPFAIRNSCKRSALWIFERIGLLRAEPYFFTYRQSFDGSTLSKTKTANEIIHMSLDEIADQSDVSWKVHYFRTRWIPRVAPYIFGLTPGKANVTYDAAKGAEFHYEVPPIREGNRVTLYGENSFNNIETFNFSINDVDIVEALSVCRGTVQIGFKVVMNPAKIERNKTLVTFWFCDPKDAILFKMRMS